MICGIRRIGMTPLLLEEKEVVPEIGPNVVICAPYVDNANIATVDETSCQAALDAILAEFDNRNLVYHEVALPDTVLKTVGIVVFFFKRSVKHTSERLY